MEFHSIQGKSDLLKQMKWITASRLVFAIILIGSCLVFSSGENMPVLSQPLVGLYLVAAAILVLSIIYLVWLRKRIYIVTLAYSQTILDSFLTTAIIYVTGSYESIFTFLYLVIIIYTAMLLFRKGSLIIATLSSIQYGLLIELEYYSIISPYMREFYLSSTSDASHMVYRVLIVIAACFAVAFLSGILALQLKVARQDLKLAQKHLKRVEKMALMDELISGIAHEVKNPLASLSGSIQLLKEEATPESYEDKLMQIILRETERLESIVNDIGLFSKPSTKNASEIQISKAIEETAALFLNDPEWNDKIDLSLELDTNIHIVIDPAHLNQILWNLLKNSAQSIPDQGKIKISLKLSKNNRVYLTIEDTGAGIPPDALGHVFDPFYTTKPDGTGLGLSIIHRLIDTYNGMIDFESRPGKGTVFTILFNGTPV